MMPRLEMAVRSVTESSEWGPNSVVQNPTRETSQGAQRTLRSCRPLAEDLKIDQDRNVETRNVENFEEGDFPALWPISAHSSQAL